jgi:transcriptional regulator with XRE-family HTH domain
MASPDVKLLFGQRVRQLRKLKGLSQEEFAHTIKLDRSYFGSVERGERNISLENIFLIANGLGVPAAELLRFETLNSSDATVDRPPTA